MTIGLAERAQTITDQESAKRLKALGQGNRGGHSYLHAAMAAENSSLT